MPKIAYNDAGEPFIADDGTQDVPRLPISDWSTSNLITGADPNQPTLFPGIRSGLSQAGRLLTGDAPFSSRQDISDKIFGSHFDPASGKAVAGNRLKTWPEQMVTNAVAGDPASMSVNPQTGEIHTSPETIERALDISGMAGGGVLGAKADVRPPLIDWENWGKTSNPIERFQDMARQNQQGVVNGRLMSDTSQPGAAIASLAPRFYSALENGVKNLTHTNSATAEEWVNALKKQPGVKQEEIDWTLHDLPQGQITKPELEQYIKEHKIELKEIVKGGQSYPYKTPDEWQNAIDKAEKQQNWSEAQKLTVAWEQFEGVGSDVNGTKYDKYQLPGGTNYREHLSILPEKHVLPPFEQWSKEHGYGDHPGSRNLYNDLISGTRKTANSFMNHHYADQGIANVVAHTRTNDRIIPGVGNSASSIIDRVANATGVKAEHMGSGMPESAVKKGIITPEEAAEWSNAKGFQNKYLGKKGTGLNSLHIETGQSDWHQKGRELGYKGDIAKLDKLQAIDDKLLASTEDIYGNPDLKEAIRTAIDRKVISPEEGKYYTENSKIDSPNAVPNAPFKKEAWVDVILKNMIRKAAEEGKDAISWTPGEAQAERWKTLAKGNGEFLKRFYNETWVNKANAITKKFGGKVEEGSIPAKTTPYKFQDRWTIPGRPEMYSSKEEALKVLAQPVHVLRITPQLRDAALNKGFALFADSGRAGAPLTALTRVEHNPFKLAEMEKQHGVKLTPVENNPFALLSDTADNAPISALAKKQKDFVNMLSQQRDFEGYQAAIRDPETKKIHSGDWHAEVLDKVAKDRGISVDELPTNLIKGFINNKGRFLTEQQVENLSRSKTNMFRSSGIPLVLNNDINNTHDVPYGAGASSDGNQVFIDKSIPQFDEKLGKLDLHQTLAVHERTEKSLMDKGMPYEHAHKIATQAEKSTVQSMGGNWNEYEKVMDGYLKGTEHENPKDPPPDLYLKPYPHDKQELLKRNADQESMTHHAEQPNQDSGLSPKALAFGALKAAEYGVWYMRPATGPYLWALTIPVGAAMNAAPMKNRRGEGYTLHKLKPVEGNPFDK